MEKKTPPRKGWLRAAALAKGAARLSYAGAILGGLFTLRYQQSEAAPSYTILSGQMRGLLSQLFFLFLLLLPLMAAALSGDLLAAYCRMRGETGLDCSLGEYLGSPEGWTELRHLAGKALPSYLMVLLVCGLLMLLVCGLLMLLVQVLGILQPMVDIWRDSWRP